MPIDTSIYNQLLRPPKTIQEYDAEATQGQANKLALAMNQAKMAEVQRGVGQENALAQAYRDSVGADGAVDRSKLFSNAAQSGLGAKLPGMQKSYADLDKTAADAAETKSKTKKTDLDSASHQFEIAGQLASAWATRPDVTKAQVQAGLAAALHSGVISPEIAQAKMAELTAVPEDSKAINVWANGTLQQVMKAKDSMSYIAPDANAKLGAQTSTDNNTATNATSRANNAATVGATIRGQNMADVRAKEAAEGKEASFTPGAIDNAAARYNIDGTLPPMGMGNAGSQARSAILNRAAELAGANGLSPDEQRIAQIGNKGNSAAISKLQQQKTMVGAFERNFNMNADIVKEFSAKVDRTGVPIMNKWINAGKRAVAGDPELSAFDASVKAVSNEYAKIVSGSMGNTAVAEGEIKKIESLLNAAQTPQQVTAVVNLMQRETHNRMQGFDDEMSSLRESMKQKKAGAAKPSLSEIFK